MAVRAIPRTIGRMKIASKSGPGRHPNCRASLTLAIPPSVNRAWANVVGKGRVHSVEYRSWRQVAGWTIRSCPRIAKIEGHVAIKSAPA